MLNRNALHALMGLEATPIKAGGFKYIHRDTGLVFEIAPATPDSAGQHTLHHIQIAFMTPTSRACSAISLNCC